MDALSLYRRLLFPSPLASYDFDSHPNETVWIPFNPRGAEEAVEQANAHSSSFPSITPSSSSSSSSSSPRSSPASVSAHPTSSPSSSSTSVSSSSPLSTDARRPSLADSSSLASAVSSSSSPSSSELPAFFLPYSGADLLMIHAHGNGIDIGGMYASESSLNSNLWSVLTFVVDVLHWPLSRVMLFGQSIGSGPCCWATAQLNRAGRHLAGVICQSAFTSIRDVVRDLVGSTAASLVAERWSSLNSAVEFISDPILLIHGLRDELISYEHSERLYERCRSERKHLLRVNGATHNDFNLLVDVVQPIAQFMSLYIKINDRQRHSRGTTREEGAGQPPTAMASPSSFTSSSSLLPPSPHSASRSPPYPFSSLSSSSSSSVDTSSDASIRLLLDRSKFVSQRLADGSSCDDEYMVGSEGEHIPINLVVPKLYRTVPAAAIAFHTLRQEAKQREEEAKVRAKERKEFIQSMWEKGKASLFAWTSSASSRAATPTQTQPTTTPSSSSSSHSLPAPSISHPSLFSSSSSSGVSRPSLVVSPVPLPTALPVPALPPPPRVAASSHLSICVASALKSALVNSQSASDLPSYSSPRARLGERPSSPGPSPSPSLSSHQPTSAACSQSHSTYLHSATHSPSLGAEDEDKEGDRDSRLLLSAPSSSVPLHSSPSLLSQPDKSTAAADEVKFRLDDEDDEQRS